MFFAGTRQGMSRYDGSHGRQQKIVQALQQPMSETDRISNSKAKKTHHKCEEGKSGREKACAGGQESYVVI